MISLEDAWRAYAEHALPLAAETIPVTAALGRVLAAPVTAAVDLPRFDQSALDGYCFRAADTAGATPATPVRLAIAQHIAAGPHGDLPMLQPGSCARIFTGAGLPPDADAVVAQERAVVDGREIVLDASWPSRRNVRLRGEEQRRGSAVAPAGARITPGLLAALINAGATEISVTRRPRIRVLTTGDEVRPVGEALGLGEIPDSNGPLIDAVLRRRGNAPLSIEHVRDDGDAVRDAMEQALADADIVITAGGASVGEHDFIVSSAAALGVQQVFWKVAQKPGKPMLFAVHQQSDRRALLLGLPGNPGAVLIGLVLHLGVILDRLEGQRAPGPRWTPAPLAADVPCDTRRARLVRMQLLHGEDGMPRLQPLPHQDSHMLGNLVDADVLVWIAAGDSPARAGSIAQWTALPS